MHSFWELNGFDSLLFNYQHDLFGLIYYMYDQGECRKYGQMTSLGGDKIVLLRKRLFFNDKSAVN